MGIGRCLPERVVDNTEVGQLVSKTPDWILKRCGVRTRRWVTNETAPQMAGRAAREALSKANLEPRRVSLVINASGTPWQVLPDGSCAVQKELGIQCAGFSLHSTCLSFLNALEVAGLMLEAGVHDHILICVSEICSKALNFEHAESAALFGDGAAAVVLGCTPQGEDSQLLACRFQTHPEGLEFTEIRGGGSRCHPADPKTNPEDNLFAMDGPPLLRLARKLLPAFLEELQGGLSQDLGDVERVLPHQASKLGLSILDRFNWPQDRMESVLVELGNVVAASIPLCLYQAITEGRVQRGDKLLLLGTGAGFSMGGVLLRY